MRRLAARQGGFRPLGTPAVLTLLALLATACSDPLAPSPAPVSFAVLVHGHISNQPLAGVPVVLIDGSARPPHIPLRPAVTDAAGVVRWSVRPGHPYTVVVRGVTHFEGVVVSNDAQWLLSLPE